jgi:hypothetical protein
MKLLMFFLVDLLALAGDGDIFKEYKEKYCTYKFNLYKNKLYLKKNHLK